MNKKIIIVLLVAIPMILLGSAMLMPSEECEKWAEIEELVSEGEYYYLLSDASSIADEKCGFSLK